MTYHAYTTLNEIREHGPCKNGWKKLLAHLGKTDADDEPLHVLTILESNGLDDALWCLRAKSLDRLSRHFQAWCVEKMLPHFEAERPDDTRVRDQIATLRNDDATQEQRAAARAAVRDASSDAPSNDAWAAAHAAKSNTASDAVFFSTWKTPFSAALFAQESQLRAMIGGPKLKTLHDFFIARNNGDRYGARQAGMDALGLNKDQWQRKKDLPIRHLGLVYALALAAIAYGLRPYWGDEK